MTHDPAAAPRRLTLLFSDMEASTRLVDRQPEAGTNVLVRHHALVGAAVASHHGRVFERIGDAAYAVFEQGTDGVVAALEIHRLMADEDWGPFGAVRVRIGLDSGELEEHEGRFFGRPLFRCARIQALARGGETLLSSTTADLVSPGLPPGLRLRDLGRQRLRGLQDSERVFAVVRTRTARPTERMEPIRVLLVDDYEVVRRGLRGFLELVPELQIVGEASTGAEAVEEAHRLEPDVVLMDLVMPEMDGAEAIAAITARQPSVACVALTSFAEPERIGRAMQAGAVGHLLKDAEADEVMAAVRAAYEGRRAATGSGSA